MIRDSNLMKTRLEAIIMNMRSNLVVDYTTILKDRIFPVHAQLKESINAVRLDARHDINVLRTRYIAPLQRAQCAQCAQSTSDQGGMPAPLTTLTTDPTPRRPDCSCDERCNILSKTGHENHVPCTRQG